MINDSFHIIYRSIYIVNFPFWLYHIQFTYIDLSYIVFLFFTWFFIFHHRFFSFNFPGSTSFFQFVWSIFYCPFSFLCSYFNFFLYVFPCPYPPDKSLLDIPPLSIHKICALLSSFVIIFILDDRNPICSKMKNN